MRILVDNSNYHLRNLGDVAMLQVAVERLRELVPSARIDVLTLAPERLARFCPGARPVDARGKHLCLSSRLERLTARLGWLPGAESLAGIARRAAGIARGRDRDPAAREAESQERAFRDTFRRADWVLATGGGYVTDSFVDHGLSVLDLLRRAALAGKRTAILGQGIGPITDSRLLAALRETAPLLGTITLREGLLGPELLRSVGLDEAQWLVTGDDAIRLARRDARDRPGDDIGWNVRLASYARIDASRVRDLGRALVASCRELGSRPRAIPISTSADCDDLASAEHLASEDPDSLARRARYESPTDVIEEIARCRVVVTGSYHAGVFALSQGIPVVALVRSSYYDGKFRGLAAQFPDGCRLVDLSADDWRSCLTGSIRTLHSESGALRPGLLEAADRQLEQTRRAYQRLVGERARPPEPVTANDP